MKYILILTALFLAGCNNSELMDARSEYVCLDHGGVYKHGGHFFKAVCNDGTVRTVNQILLPEGHRVGE